MSEERWKLSGVIAFSLAVAGIAASVVAARRIVLNGWLSQGLAPLALFALRDAVTRWSLAALAAGALGWLAGRLVLGPLVRGTRSRAEAEPPRSPRLGFALPLGVGSIACLGVAVVFALGWGDALAPRIVPGVRHLHAIHRVTSAVFWVALAAGVGLLGTVTFTLRGWLATGRPRAVAARLRSLVHSRPVLAVGAAVFGIAVGLNTGVWAWERLARPVGPNVLLISVDTLRADHLGCYGGSRPVSPNIDALARRGVLYERAYSQAPWTLPSMASVMTSLYPSEHAADAFNRRIAEPLVTLAERLRGRLYATGGIVTHHFTGREFGFAQGFESFNEEHILGDEGVSSPELTRDAIRFLEAHRNGAFFLWVHYFDPHYSYVEHEEYPWSRDYHGPLESPLKIKRLEDSRGGLTEADVQFVRDVYDEEVAFTDHSIGTLLEALDRLDLSGRTLVVLVGDHGEEFMDRGNFGHGTEVYDELVRVPLVLAGPGVEPASGGRITRVVETRAIPATLLRLCGLGRGGFAGEDLLQPEAGASAPAASTAAGIEGSYAWGSDRRKIAVVSNGWKLIEELDSRRMQLFDLSADPHERTDLFGADDTATAAARRDLTGRLAEFHRTKRRRSEETPLSPATEDQLRSLGYIR